MKVLDVTVPAGMLELLQLDNEMEVQPVYILSCTADAVKTIAWQAPAESSPDELRVNRPVVQGADGYDLEWAYVDSSTLTSARFGQPLNPALVFDNNTTRVSLAENTYAIPPDV